MDQSGGDVDNEGDSACVGVRDVRESSITPPWFCSEPKSDLKHKVLIQILKIKEYNYAFRIIDPLHVFFDINMLHYLGEN